MKLCYLCGGIFLDEQAQEIQLDLKREYICEACAVRALLIAGQVKLPGWIAGFWQPRKLGQLVQQHGYYISNEQLADLCELGRDDCIALLQERYDEYWSDLGIPTWLKDQEIIQL